MRCAARQACTPSMEQSAVKPPNLEQPLRIVPAQGAARALWPRHKLLLLANFGLRSWNPIALFLDAAHRIGERRKRGSIYKRICFCLSGKVSLIGRAFRQAWVSR